jgi:uncharacterized protein
LITINLFASTSGGVRPSSLELMNAVENGIMNNTNLILLLAVLITFGIYMLIFAIKKKNMFREVGFKAVGIDKLISGALIGLGLSIIIGFILNLLPIDKLFPDYENIVNSIISKENIFFIVFVTSFVVPIFEETLFRGIVFNELKKIIPVSVSVIIQGLLFGIFHLNLLQGIYAFFLGCVLALLYNWTKSLWTNIFAHSMFNASNFFLDKLPNLPMIVYLILGIIIAILPLFYLWSKRRKIEFN